MIIQFLIHKLIISKEFVIIYLAAAELWKFRCPARSHHTNGMFVYSLNLIIKWDCVKVYVHLFPRM